MKTEFNFSTVWNDHSGNQTGNSDEPDTGGQNELSPVVQITSSVARALRGVDGAARHPCQVGDGSKWECIFRSFAIMAALLLIPALITGCGSSPKKQNKDFFTSGSKDADQRASQRMAKQEQLTGSGEGSGERGVKRATSSEGTASDGSTNKAAQAEAKLALFDRLGGEQGISAIVDDFLPRVIQDPRVNWQRKNVKRGGLFRSNKADAWQATPANVEQLKKHFVQFLALATGGPAHYEGKEIASSHAGMRITNPEFDAAVGDLKASLDRLKIPNTEQKELLAIIESTRPQIVTVR
jgi:hemoglobin